MISKRLNLRLVFFEQSFALGIGLALITLAASTNDVFATPKPKITSPGSATGTVGVPFSYQITADQVITTWGAAPLPAWLSLNTSTGLLSGTPTTATTYSITLSATNGNGTGTQPLTLTISAPTPTPGPTAFVGFRLPDFPANPTPSPTPAANNMRLMLQIGATQGGVAHPFNATLEVDASGGLGTAWVPYNHFVGITDPSYAVKDGWITNAPLPVRDLPGSSPAPSPYPSPPAFSTAQLIQSPPGVYMKADPRATRFGIFQMDTNPTGNSRTIDSLWPKGVSAPSSPTPPPNGYGGTVATTFPGPVEHAPNRFSGVAYYPGTFCINPANGLPDSPRDTAVTTYADNDNVTRPADAIYPGTASHTGESTPYYTTSTSYRPIILNRPFRNVAELGYAFRDLPWKTLDFFTDKSADAGLLDVFCIHDGAQSTTSYNGTDLGNVVPTMVAGKLGLNSVYLDPSNSALAPVGQPILAGAIWDEISSSTVVPTGSGPQTAQTMTSNLAAATSATRMQNKSELITRTNLPTTLLPTASNDNQAVKARREVVARAVSSVSQTRVWNLVIDVVAQSGHFKPNATNLQNDFVVEGEQHYWVHVAIDRFTGQVIDKQIETVKE